MQNTLSAGYELHRAGKHKQALQHYKSVLKQAPKNPDALMLMGILHYEMAKYGQAVQYLSKASKQAPHNESIYFNLGLAYQSQDRLADAASAFTKALEISPNNPNTMYCLGATLVKLDDTENGVRYLHMAAPSMPDNADLFLWLGTGSSILGDHDTALSSLLKTIALQPNSTRALCLLAEMPITHVRPKDAKKYIQRAYEIAPDAPQVMIRQAGWLEKQGELDEARTLFSDVLKKSSDYPFAHIGLAKIDMAQKNYEEAVKRLNSTISHNSSPEVRHKALAVLCKAHNKLGHYDEALKAAEDKGAILNTLNEYKSLNANLTPSIFKNTLAWLDDLDTKAPIAKSEPEVPTPVFFIGFPRSGTTLMEMMLASHPSLQTSGEFPAIGKILEMMPKVLGRKIDYPKDLTSLDDAELTKLRTLYWELFSDELEFDPSERTLIDKNPMNITYMPIIGILFPNAKIIMALRDPRDVCISNQMQSFALNTFMMHMTDMSATASLYVNCLNMYRHVKHSLGIITHEYRYEDLIDNFEETVQGVLDFLEIPWDDGVANYQETAKNTVVSTPSYTDVSKNLSRKAIGQWKNYAHLMPEALDILADDVKYYGYEETK